MINLLLKLNYVYINTMLPVLNSWKQSLEGVKVSKVVHLCTLSCHSKSVKERQWSLLTAVFICLS